MLSEEHFIILENELLRTEKMSAMYAAKSNLVKAIFDSHDDKLIKTYCYYNKDELTLDEFLTEITDHYRGDDIASLVFKYMLSIIAVNEENSRVCERKTYIVEWSTYNIFFAPFGGKNKVTKSICIMS